MFKPYTGTLTGEQLAGGRIKALSNAEEILSDAQALADNNRWSRALFLAHIAVEEAGKYFYLIGSCIDVARGKIQWKVFWKTVRSHNDKTGIFLLMEEALIPTPPGKKPPLDFAGQAKVLSMAKLWGLYADYAQKEFYQPSEIIPEEMGKQALSLARKRVELAREFEGMQDWDKVLGNLSEGKIKEMDKFFSQLLAKVVKRAEEESADA